MSARRTQKERREETRRLLIASGQSLFGTAGYDATSLDAVVADASVTKGALYHHFPKGKAELFEHVVLAEQNALVTAVTSVSQSKDQNMFEQQLAAYFDAATKPSTYRITMIDAPVVLGRSRWREIEYAHGAQLIESGYEENLASSDQASTEQKITIAALYGAFSETTVAVAEAIDKKAAKKAAIDVMIMMCSQMLRRL